MANHYDVLGVRRDSSLEEIKQAYHRLAMEYHPDKNPSPWAAEKMRQINEAYRVLGDPALREDYDRRTFHETGGNIYARWYERRPGFEGGAAWMDPSPWYASDGYEAPRRAVVYESVTLFSLERLLAGGIVGLASGIAITMAFIFFGVDPGEPGSGQAFTMLLAAFSASLSPLMSVLLMREDLSSRAEAGMCGSITLTFALPIAVLAGSFVRESGDACMTCCMLPFACIVAGWLIGGFVGRAAWDVFHG